MKNISEFAQELSNAYSTDRYRNGWSGCIRMLRRRRYNDRQIEAIIRSKWTRWAGDASYNSYGRVTSTDLSNFLDKQTDLNNQIEDLVAQTFWR